MNIKNFTPEQWVELDRMVEQSVDFIARDMTPDFSKEDWMELYRNGFKQGDMTSLKLFLSLFQRKGQRYIQLQTRHMSGDPITDEEMEELIKIRNDK